MKERILRNWHLLRWLRAGLGTVFLIQGIVSADPAAMVLGSILGLQALLDLGCCSVAGGCGVPAQRPSERQEPITWQEIR